MLAPQYPIFEKPSQFTTTELSGKNPGEIIRKLTEVLQSNPKIDFDLVGGKANCAFFDDDDNTAVEFIIQLWTYQQRLMLESCHMYGDVWGFKGIHDDIMQRMGNQSCKFECPTSLFHRLPECQLEPLNDYNIMSRYVKQLLVNLTNYASMFEVTRCLAHLAKESKYHKIMVELEVIRELVEILKLEGQEVACQLFVMNFLVNMMKYSSGIEAKLQSQILKQIRCEINLVRSMAESLSNDKYEQRLVQKQARKVLSEYDKVFASE